ncbi:hypothetical protein KI387_032745, partial [Taxus chinensis]
MEEIGAGTGTCGAKQYQSQDATEEYSLDQQKKRKYQSEDATEECSVDQQKKRRGRPLGSRNK